MSEQRKCDKCGKIVDASELRLIYRCPDSPAYCQECYKPYEINITPISEWNRGEHG